MASKANPRNHRNNPYALDMFAAQVHHSAAGALFRFRTELFILLMGLGAFAALALTASWIWALIILTALGPCAVRAALDPPIHRPPGLVRDLPAPAAAGLLRNPHAHKVWPSVTDLVDPAYSGG
jgi:hypothetical protein